MIEIPLAYLPRLARRAASKVGLVARNEEGTEYIRIGPVPKRTPINLLANLDLSLTSLRDTPKAVRLASLGVEIRDVLTSIASEKPTPDETFERMKERLLPSLMANSNCLDLVEDRGHYYGASLPDADKEALIEFLKTL